MIVSRMFLCCRVGIVILLMLDSGLGTGLLFVVFVLIEIVLFGRLLGLVRIW